MYHIVHFKLATRSCSENSGLPIARVSRKEAERAQAATLLPTPNCPRDSALSPLRLPLSFSLYFSVSFVCLIRLSPPVSACLWQAANSNSNSNSGRFLMSLTAACLEQLKANDVGVGEEEGGGVSG